MAQVKEVRGVQTDITVVNGVTQVSYRGTPVVRFNPTSIVFNSGGFRGPTTLRRMLQTVNQFDLKVRVFQKKGEWYVATPWSAKPLPYGDGHECAVVRWDMVASLMPKKYAGIERTALAPTGDGDEAKRVILDLMAEDPSEFIFSLLKVGER